MDASKDKKYLIKNIKILEYVTITWNIFEGTAAIIAGMLAGSLSLVAFGLSSGLEVFAGIVVLWEMTSKDKSKEKIALKLIGSGYFIVAAYILWNAVEEFLQHHHALPSPVGIILLIATVIIMFVLAYYKKDLGKKLQRATVIAEANYSLIDGSLATAVLVGLLLNLFFGLWWADELMAICIAAFAIKEGIEEFFAG